MWNYCLSVSYFMAVLLNLLCGASKWINLLNLFIWYHSLHRIRLSSCCLCPLNFTPLLILLSATIFSYGLVWISTTLVFVLASLGNCATYLMQKRSDSNTSWTFDVGYVNVAAFTVYGYVLLAPLAFYFLFQYMCAKASLVQFWCLWGYSLFIFNLSSVSISLPYCIIKSWLFAKENEISSIFQKFIPWLSNPLCHPVTWIRTIGTLKHRLARFMNLMVIIKNMMLLLLVLLFCYTKIGNEYHHWTKISWVFQWTVSSSFLLLICLSCQFLFPIHDILIIFVFLTYKYWVIIAEWH